MLSDNLRRARKKRGWSRGQLAQASGVHENTIADIERGRSRSPAYDKVVSLARALEMPADKLCPVPQKGAA